MGKARRKREAAAGVKPPVSTPVTPQRPWEVKAFEGKRE